MHNKVWVDVEVSQPFKSGDYLCRIEGFYGGSGQDTVWFDGKAFHPDYGLRVISWTEET